MSEERKTGAAEAILAVMGLAALLLWIDSDRHSVPVMLLTAAVALGFIYRLRSSPKRRDLTYGEEIMRERESAYRWLASQDLPELEESPKKKLRLIDGGKEPDHDPAEARREIDPS